MSKVIIEKGQQIEHSENLCKSRVGVVAITLASHARGREFEPRIRYFFLNEVEANMERKVIDG